MQRIKLTVLRVGVVKNFNVPETFGLSINDALQNWIVRTDDYTAESFVDYINSKNTGYLAMTEAAFKKHN